MRNLGPKLIEKFCNSNDWDLAQVIWIQGQDASILYEEQESVVGSENKGSSKNLLVADSMSNENVLLKNASFINLSR